MLPTNMQFNGKSVLPERRDHWDQLLRDYANSRLAPPNICSEIRQGLSGETKKFWAYLWEAMLYRHFRQIGFEFRNDYQRTSGQHGPDFGLVDDGHTIWIEAVVPEPKGVPTKWLNADGLFGPETFDAIRLRWTAKLLDKCKQLDCRIKKGVVGTHDAYVIALNSCMLHQMEGEDFGISQLPFAVEAVLPVGPLSACMPVPGLRSSVEDRTPLKASPGWQCEIKKSNGSPVRTDNFLDKNYSKISAVIGCSRVSMPDGNAYLIAVHNPLADNPICLGTLGAHVEYTVEDISDNSFVLKPHPQVQTTSGAGTTNGPDQAA
jgi:hypothetical protein